MAKATFRQQFLALLKRNLLLKKRNKRDTSQEIFFPIYFVLILALIRGLSAPRQEPAISNFPEHSLNQTQFALTSGKIFVTPDSTNVKMFMDEVTKNMISGPDSYNISYYANETSMVQEYLRQPSGVVAGVNFVDDSLSVMSYTIRTDFAKSPMLMYAGQGDCRQPDGLATQRCEANKYLFSGFTSLQTAIDTSLIRLKTGQTNFPVPQVSVQQMPKQSWTPNVTYLQILASIYFVLAYSPFINFLTVSLVAEKEKKIKEGLRMMGMRDAAFWLSWGIIYAVVIAVVTVIVIIIAWASRLFSNSNVFIFYLILFLYGLTIINMAFMMTPFFSKAETAGALAGFATLIFSLLYLVVSLTRTTYTADGPVSSIPVGGQIALCLLSPVALALALDQGIFLDVARGGLTFSNMTVGQLPVYVPMIMMLVDFVLYGLIAVYLDNVVPTEYGVRRPFYFFLMPSYWCPRERSAEEIQQLLRNTGDEQSINTNPGTDSIEAVPQDMASRNVLRMFNIKKVYSSKEKMVTAVNGISLDMYEGQITALLGHNGAGKTTLINMLTGLTPSSSGTATIYGLDVNDTNDMNEIRSMTGVCPQHNILFDDLSCREHLEVCAKLKGIASDQVERVVEESLGQVDLTDQGDTFSKHLSGGQKRKLSVAMALIGDPKVIFLDEPTAGMDPYSRRHLWTLLQNKREGRLILLTTHYMDEADILADRKAFVNKGQLQCCGSSLFLKNRFGVGYHLGLVVEPSANQSDITTLVQSHIPDAELDRSHSKELVYILPLGSVSSFAGLFSELEQTSGTQSKAEELGIKSFGVSMTTLEEVFLKLEEYAEGDDEEAEEDVVQNAGCTKRVNTVEPQENPSFANGSIEEVNHTTGQPTVVEMGNSPLNHSEVRPSLKTEVNLTKQRFFALAKIKLLYCVRHPAIMFFRLVMPVIFICIGAALQRFLTPRFAIGTEPARQFLTPFLYTRNVFVPSQLPPFVYQVDPSGGDNTSDYIAGLVSQGMETLRINDSEYLIQNRPHHLGMNISYVQAVSMGIESIVTAMYNDTAVHSLPVTINTISNALLKMATGSFLDPTVNITAWSRPWPQIAGATGFQGGVFSSTILLGMALAILPAGFAIFVVRERQIKTRSQLRIAGISMNMYWAVQFSVDLTQFALVAFLSVIALVAFQSPPIMYAGAVLSMIILYILYMPVTMLLGYIFSYAFEKYETCQTVLPNVFSFSAFIPYMAVSMLDMFGNENAATIIHYVCAVIDPPYAVFGGLYYIARVYTKAMSTQGSNPVIPISAYFRWDSNIPICYIMPLLHAIWMYFVLRLLEVRLYGGDVRDVCLCGSGYTMTGTVTEENDDIPENEDSDVAQERERTINMDPASSDKVILVKGLRKEFKKTTGGSCDCKKKSKAEKTKVAVSNNTFSVAPGEVLGLLGPNGAGKTTTINMIIAEQGPTKGKVVVAGNDIRSALSDAFDVMGYCPQHDAQWDLITLKEHIQVYAAIKGVPNVETDSLANYFIEELKLQEHANKYAKKLSGGTKRKLSYAMSMLGSPQVVLLDEPSTGMDPKSKRFLWDTISSSFSGSDRGAILTTHYMEEADALCSRVAIMINGKMRCIGSTQHLKDKHGSGYLLEVKLQSRASEGEMEERMESLHQFIRELFPDHSELECFAERAMYKVPRNNVVSLANIFDTLEKGKETLGIEEYSFSQATLEQVFLEFAKQQVEEGTDQTQEDTEEAAQRARSRSSVGRTTSSSPSV